MKSNLKIQSDPCLTSVRDDHYTACVFCNDYEELAKGLKMLSDAGADKPRSHRDEHGLRAVGDIPVQIIDRENIVQCIPNMDGFVNRKDLDAIRAECKSMVALFTQLASYAEAKSNAMQCREQGKIELAQKFESACDHVYTQLPDWAKVW